jgi:hypothetical protein
LREIGRVSVRRASLRTAVGGDDSENRDANGKRLGL